jgi:bacillithiol synthase
MPGVMGPSLVRARVLPRAEPPADHLYDPFVERLLAGPSAGDFFSSSWRDDEALRRLSEKRAPLDRSLARALREYHERLGAGPRSLRALERLASGEAVCTIAGQQPGPLGGPLYALHKTAAAVGMARRFEARTGVPCAPAFWNHTEDSDFEEIRAITVADAALALHELSLDESARREGGLVGDLPAALLLPVHQAARGHWSGLPGQAAAMDLLGRAMGRAQNLGDAHAAILLELFAEQGLVVVDPRLPEFRRAARPILERYLERAEALGEAARAAGARLESSIGRRPLADPALESFVFLVEDGVRHKISVADARRLGPEAALVPSVALRPAVQDGVLPTVAMACGPGELAYLAQLREIFEGVGVRAACPVPRLGATWLPRAALELIEASGADPWRAVIATDSVLRALAEARVPAGLPADLEALRHDLAERLRGFAERSTSLDPSLPQMVESARGKMDFQLARLADGLVGKARHRLERAHPEWLRLRYYLLPGDRLQERRIASLEPIAHRGPAVTDDLCDLAETHAHELERGEHAHFVLEL